MSKIKLKLCPFCGYPAKLREYDCGDYPPEYTVQCSNIDKCGAEIIAFNLPEKAAEAWNSRICEINVTQKGNNNREPLKTALLSNELAKYHKKMLECRKTL